MIYNNEKLSEVLVGKVHPKAGKLSDKQRKIMFDGQMDKGALKIIKPNK